MMMVFNNCLSLSAAEQSAVLLSAVCCCLLSAVCVSVICGCFISNFFKNFSQQTQQRQQRHSSRHRQQTEKRHSRESQNNEITSSYHVLSSSLYFSVPGPSSCRSSQSLIGKPAFVSIQRLLSLTFDISACRQ